RPRRRSLGVRSRAAVRPRRRPRPRRRRRAGRRRHAGHRGGPAAAARRVERMTFGGRSGTGCMVSAQGGNPMRKISVLAAAMLVSTLVADVATAEHDDDDEAVSEKDLRAAKVSLEDGLAASEASGTPISAKFEMEDGKLQLSVYVAKGPAFTEVIVD